MVTTNKCRSAHVPVVVGCSAVMAQTTGSQLRQGYALFREDIRDLAALTTDKAGVSGSAVGVSGL